MFQTPDKHILKLWKMAIELLPPEIRSISMYCQLVKYDPENKIAEIHADSEGLIEILNIRKSNLEQAFAAVLLNPVEIRFSSNSSGTASTTKNVSLKNIQSLESSHFIQSESKQQNNQGINSPYKWNNLYFRSKSEIEIAKILNEREILFFPNIKGRVSVDGRGMNREIDFLICHRGMWGVLECDGEEYHQTAAKDHERDRVWHNHGIWFIQRFSATECYQQPGKVVDTFLNMLGQYYEHKK